MLGQLIEFLRSSIGPTRHCWPDDTASRILAIWSSIGIFYVSFLAQRIEGRVKKREEVKRDLDMVKSFNNDISKCLTPGVPAILEFHVRRASVAAAISRYARTENIWKRPKINALSESIRIYDPVNDPNRSSLSVLWNELMKLADSMEERS